MPRAALFLLLAAFLPACIFQPPVSPDSGTAILPVAAPPPPIVTAPDNLPPGSPTLLIHALTRVGTDSEGRPAILIHLELHDRADHDVKPLGHVRVDLAAPDPESDPTAARTWLIDLTDPKTNARAYDSLVTGTYSFALGAIPAALTAWSQQDPAVLSPGPTLTVYFTTLDPSKPGDPSRTLMATRRLTR